MVTVGVPRRAGASVEVLSEGLGPEAVVGA